MLGAPPRHVAGLLRSAARRRCSADGAQLHCHLIKSNVLHSPPLPSALLDFYCKSDNLLHFAHQLFDELSDLHSDPVLWSSLISAHSRSGNPHFSLNLFRRMAKLCNPDGHIFATIANVCAQILSSRAGRQVHAQFLKSDFANDDIVKSALVDMYSKCRAPEDARKVFDMILNKNRVCWTAMISGYAANGLLLDAVELFQVMPEKDLLTWTALISGLVHSGNFTNALEIFVQMREEGIKIVDAFVLSSVVSASADLAALDLGKQLHCLVLRLGYAKSVIIGNSLVDMYAKCSDIFSSRSVFDTISRRDIFSWTTMVVGEAQHGRAEEAFDLFDQMMNCGVRPNEVTFVGLLYACSHAGLVDKGRKLFNSMVTEYGIDPSLQHYTCLLDLLSRSGFLSEAEELMNSMPFEPDEAMWSALLSSSKKHGQNDMSIRIADHLMSLKPRDPSTCVLISNVYAISGKWDQVTRLRKVMSELEIKKEPGYSLIELGKERRLFRAGEVPSEMKIQIIELLEGLVNEMRKRGYIPDTSSVMHDVQEHEKEQLLFLHSERLAAAYGILKAVPGAIIRIVKNLRICEDCHNVLKMISDIAAREIVVRDATRFHHFKNGGCSCSDFW